MKVVSFINPKGGVGKSTSVINVATCLVRSGYSVAVVDCSGQAKLATALEFFQNNRSDSFGVKPPLY
ncbi:hypothetical protein CBW54_15790 [Yersinia kristensenii]|nr:hypothetical protein CBW54_15790 [Yersinia kristensenii]